MSWRAILRSHGDALLAAVLAVLMTGELVAFLSGPELVPLVLGLLTTGPFVLRRRSPLVCFVLVMTGIELLSYRLPGFDNDSSAFIFAFFIALYSLGRYTRGTEAWLGVAGVVVAMTLFVNSEGGLSPDLGDVAFVLGFAGAPWAAGLTLRLRREREATLRTENERLRLEQEALAARAVAEERSRIARELHDVVSHAISVTVLQARGARRVLDSDPAAARGALDAIEETNAAALGDMRRLLAVLRDTEPEGLDLRAPSEAWPGEERTPQPSIANLDALLAHVRGSGVPVEVAVDGEPADLPPGVDLSAYRIVQEALTNVLKHAAEASATVRLTYAPDALTVAVTDDGIPGPLEERGVGHGLIGIRERVSVVGGDVEVGPGPEGGFTVRARLPYALELS